MSSEILSRAAALRAWACHQGFGSSATHSPQTIVATRGWVRTLGGADPYFGLFARGAQLELAPISAAVQAGELRVTPAVRGCMYLVAAAHADLALSVAHHGSQVRSQRDIEKAGGTAKQIDKTAKAIVRALEAGPQTTAELRKGPAAKAIVSFGDKGKKVGSTSSLPVALRQLEFDGAIERTPIDGRLDTETYQWSVRQTKLTKHAPADAERAIAAMFFEHHSPASFEHFVAWSGLGKKVAKAAMAELDLVEVEVETHADEPEKMWATVAAMKLAYSKAKPKGVALLGLQDLYLVVRGGPSSVCPAAHLDVEIPRWGPIGGGSIRATKHPHLRALLVDGMLAGFWDVNARMDEQVLAWLDTPSKTVARAAERQVAGLRSFMAAELGHSKIYSIDSDAKIDARFELVRGLGS
ncbi:DNA glycosylase AlkZ-like family protein [Enhygromyxa salina]|nr:crosslink repair DNA glycosylase YcaQ family protein [Enhygromyxa salina]